MSKLIVVMIDGVSADYFSKHKKRLPFLSRLASMGMQVERLHSVQPATSLPGRSTLMTGVSANIHGIFGNTIWDGERFRYATPDDVAVPSLAKLAKDAGLDVAVLGYGMLKPEDANVFHHAWWVGEMVQRARDNSPIPAHEGWLRTVAYQDSTGRLAELAEQGYAKSVINPYTDSSNPKLDYLLAELAGDATMMQWAAGLACSKQAPDLIVTEILTPDSVQHSAGYESDLAHWSIQYADALVGQLLETLSSAQAPYTLALMSDHGHGAVTSALYPSAIIPEATYACECGWLYVNYQTEAELREIAAKLAEHSIEHVQAEHIPERFSSSIATFLAPEGCAFEGEPSQLAKAPATTLSTHGFKPGSLSDDRFCLFAGSNIPKRVVAKAQAVQIAPTLASILGLSSSQFEGISLI